MKRRRQFIRLAVIYFSLNTMSDVIEIEFVWGMSTVEIHNLFSKKVNLIYRSAFSAVMFDNGQRVFMESIEPLPDGFFVVVDASGSQTFSNIQTRIEFFYLFVKKWIFVFFF